jgi:hypothetical protein
MHVRDGQAIKDIYVYPLCRTARKRLCQDPAPKCTGSIEAAE